MILAWLFTCSIFLPLPWFETIKPSERPLIQNSGDSYNLLRQVWDQNKPEMQEEFKVLLLNRKEGHWSI